MHGFVDNGSSEAGIRLEMEKEVLLSKLVEQKDAELNRATIQVRPSFWPCPDPVIMVERSGQLFPRLAMQMESYKQQLELERQIKAVEIDLARERQGNMAAMVGLALVHRNQLEAQAAKALTMHALKEAARVEREANEKRQQLLVSTAWWLEAKVGSPTTDQWKLIMPHLCPAKEPSTVLSGTAIRCRNKCMDKSSGTSSFLNVLDLPRVLFAFVGQSLRASLSMTPHGFQRKC